MIPEVDYIIPVSCPEGLEFEDRVETFQYVVNSFLARQTGVVINTVIVEQITNPCRGPLLENHRADSCSRMKLIQVYNPVFNKCWLYNIGLRSSHSQHVFLADLDCVYLEDKLKYALDFAINNSMKWFIAWDTLHLTGLKCKSRIISRGVVDWSDCETLKKDMKVYSGYEGGLVYFTRKFLVEELGGCNEFFRDLGGEDNSLAHRARAGSGQNRRLRSDLFHLHHATSPLKKSLHLPFNWRLLAYTLKNAHVSSHVMRRMWTDGNSGRIDSPACDRTSFNKERLDL